MPCPSGVNPGKQKRLSEDPSIPDSASGVVPEEKFNWEWYDPPEDGLLVGFCDDTSLHGIQYIGQQGRHMCERVFWFLATLAAAIYGTVFIWRMWTEYIDMPIETVYNPTEKTLAEIPFPAFTICNVNNIRKSRTNGYIKEAMKNISGDPRFKNYYRDAYLQTLAAISDVNHICESKKTFSERFTLGIPQVEKLEKVEGELEKNKDFIEYKMNPTITLRKGSQPCNEMILFCLWQDEIRDCSDLFHEIETDYGICCTFNLIPITLLKKFKYRGDVKDDPQKVDAWKSSTLNCDNLLFDKDNDQDRKYPLRQLYPGRSAGLSFLLDPDLDEYDCTNTDSEGFIASVNVPLDFPRMRDSNGIAIPTKSEVFISVRPEVTMSDESVQSYELGKRRCYFGGEYDLPHYTKYTASNCMDECFAETTYQMCKCKHHYMPRGKNETLCRSSSQHKCTDQVRKKIIQTGLDKECNYCLPTCTEIEYHTETTSLRIQRKAVANLMRQYPNNTSFQNLSIVHVYFGMDAIYPRLRKELTSTIDLISNAGGLLGFCMGFSILSVLEFVYYITMRLFFKIYRTRSEKNKGGFRYNHKQIIAAVIILVVIVVVTYYLRNVIVRATTWTSK